MNINFKVKDHFYTKDEFNLEYNPSLEMYFTSPQPKNLEAYYPEQNYISHTGSTKGLKNFLYYLIKKITLKSKIKLVLTNTYKLNSILDIGAGTGDFLLYCKKQGWCTEGLEPNKNAREKAAAKGIHLKTDINSLSLNKYDAITLWHVLEHIPNLENYIDDLLLRIKDSGSLFIAVPNYKSWDAQYYKDYWAAFDVPRHLWHFSNKSIELLFQKRGLTITKIYPMKFDSYYVSLLSEKYKTGKHNYLKALINGFKSNLQAKQTKQYSSLIYVLKRT